MGLKKYYDTLFVPKYVLNNTKRAKNPKSPFDYTKGVPATVQPSKLEERKKVRLSKEVLTKTDFVNALSTLTSGHFAASGSSET